MTIDSHYISVEFQMMPGEFHSIYIDVQQLNILRRTMIGYKRSLSIAVHSIYFDTLSISN